MKAIIIILILFVSSINYLSCQSLTTEADKKFTVVFYNVENFFDTIVDTLKKNDDFDMGGLRNWNKYKYSQKVNSVYKVLTAIEGWNKLALIGLAEVESDQVISDLISKTPFAKHNFKYCHFDSRDPRGIDVALIYDSAMFKVLKSTSIEVADESDVEFTTRDILYVYGKALETDLHIFIVHFTSRYRGLLESQQKRLLCASVLKNKIDSIIVTCQYPNIIVMGDFNDTDSDRSLKQLLREQGYLNRIEHIPQYGSSEGTLKYQNNWYTFDHILLSDAILVGESGIISDKSIHIFDPSFLLEKDAKYNGFKPKRTYIGYKYNKGYSDHLPIYFHLYQITNDSI